MRFWNKLICYDQKQSLEYIDCLERYLVRLKRAVYNAKNGLGVSMPQLDKTLKFPKKVLFNGYSRKDFHKTVSMLEIRISLEKSQFEKIEMG